MANDELKVASIEIRMNEDYNYTAIMRDGSNNWLTRTKEPFAYLHEAVENVLEDGARQQQDAAFIQLYDMTVNNK